MAITLQDRLIAQGQYRLAAERQPGGFVAAMIVQWSLWRLWVYEYLSYETLFIIGTVFVGSFVAGTVAFFQAAPSVEQAIARPDPHLAVPPAAASN